jgi:hypothetical protein
MDDKKVAGHRAWDPPDPIPNSEVKPRSVLGASVVFGHVNPRKLAIISTSREPTNIISLCNHTLAQKTFLGNTQNLLHTSCFLRKEWIT